MFEALFILFIILFVIGSIFFLINTEEVEKNRSIYQTLFMIILLSICWYTAIVTFNSPKTISFTNRLGNLVTGFLFPILLYLVHRLIPQKLKRDYFLYMLLYMIFISVALFTLLLVLIKMA